MCSNVKDKAVYTMDNGMENMLDIYLFETNSLLEQLEELLISAETVTDFTTDDVNEIFRIMHTIKGSSAMMQFNSLMEIAHHIEDLFFFIRENGIHSLTTVHKTELFNFMFRSTDFLRTEVEKLQQNEPLSTNVDHFVAEINTFLDKISMDKDVQIKPADEGLSSHLLQIFFEEEIGMEHLRAFMLVNTLKEAELDFTYQPSDIENNSNASTVIVEQGFHLSFTKESHMEKAISIIKSSSNILSYEIIKEADITATSPEPNLEQPASLATVTETEELHQELPAKTQTVAPPATNNNTKQNLISVNLSKLDNLMAIVGEIVITESMVTSCFDSANLNIDNFLKSTRQLRKLTHDLQDIAMSLRMVPVSGVFQKMNRIVRDMKQKLGKDVRLTLVGEHTEVDKSIVDSIGDPIMHIVRNSMDHGIESTKEERIAAGKNPQGEIILSANHTGGEVIITIEDDGQGMDPKLILAKAKKNNLLTKPEQDYTTKEILQLLMVPGFSTNDAVTEFSGRGVGMDVVKRNVESVGGVVSISSEQGLGSCTTLKIPLTMSIVSGMEVSVGNSIFTIPIAHIQQAFKITSQDVIYDSNDNEMVECMGKIYPIVRLHKFFNLDTEVTALEDGILVLVEALEKSYCLFLDKLIGEQQVVVKPLPSYLNRYHIKNYGISGCTILGDGNISIILDIVNMYQLTQTRINETGGIYHGGSKQLK